MRWIEMIRVSATRGTIQDMLTSIKDHLLFFENVGKGLERILVVVHTEYRDDLAVILIWNNEHPPAKSREGLMLADYLVSRGIVGHTVWGCAAEWVPGIFTDVEQAGDDCSSRQDVSVHRVKSLFKTLQARMPADMRDSQSSTDTEGR